MFKPASDSFDKGGAVASRPKYRNDYDIIKKDMLAFYVDVIGGQKNNASLIIVLFVLYGLMYFIVTSTHYFYMPPTYRHSAVLSEYLMVAGVFILFFPVMIMHSWKFIDAGSPHLIDRLFSCRSVFLAVTISYVVMLIVTLSIFSDVEMPLALTLPIIVSALVPSLLHALTDSV